VHKKPNFAGSLTSTPHTIAAAAAAAAMATTSNPLVLIGGVDHKIYDPTCDIIADFGRYRKVYVDNSKFPHSFYLVYSEKHYGTDNTGSTALVPSNLFSGNFSEPVHLSFDAASAQGYDFHDPAIYLFEHYNYKGNPRIFRASEKDLRPTFGDSGDWRGVSSLIITGGVWNLYGSTDFKPPLLRTVKKGDYISFLYSDNDKVLSVQRVQDF
jgi:hypothetical protein